MTKDEAKAAVMRLMRAECTCGIPGVKEPCFACEMSAGLDVLAQAAANADTLGMLEEIARQEWAATLETGDEEHFKVRVQQNPDRTAGGFRYWIAEPGERLGEETTRAEAQALLLAGEEKKG